VAVSALVISIILTVIILILTLVTISKGYGYKHTIDPLVKENEKEGDDRLSD